MYSSYSLFLSVGFILFFLLCHSVHIYFVLTPVLFFFSIECEWTLLFFYYPFQFILRFCFFVVFAWMFPFSLVNASIQILLVYPLFRIYNWHWKHNLKNWGIEAWDDQKEFEYIVRIYKNTEFLFWVCLPVFLFFWFCAWLLASYKIPGRADYWFFEHTNKLWVHIGKITIKMKKKKES